MKWLFVFLFSSFYLSTYSQTLGDDTLHHKEKKPLYEIEGCVVPLIKYIVDNCDFSTSLNKHVYGYLFFSKKKETGFSIFINPIGTSWSFNTSLYTRLYGIFELQGKKFYCIGDVPDFLFNKTVPEFIEIEYNENPILQQDTIAITLVMDRLSDLNTMHIAKNIILNEQLYSFYIQPCENFTKKVIKKIRKTTYCD